MWTTMLVFLEKKYSSVYSLYWGSQTVVKPLNINVITVNVSFPLTLTFKTIWRLWFWFNWVSSFCKTLRLSFNEELVLSYHLWATEVLFSLITFKPNECDCDYVLFASKVLYYENWITQTAKCDEQKTSTDWSFGNINMVLFIFTSLYILSISSCCVVQIEQSEV